MRPQFWTVLALLLLTAVEVRAQRDRDTYNPNNTTFEVAGQVNLAGQNTPIRDIQVRLERFSGGIVDQMATDPRGRFRFANLQRGYYRVIINASGYSPSQQDADLTLLFRAFLLFSLVRNDGSSTAKPIPAIIDSRIPEGAREEYARGRAALSKDNRAGAISHLKKALSLHAQFFEAELLLATVFMDRREWSEAEAALNRALQIKPEDPTALMALGEVYWRQKRYEEAERNLVAGLQLDEKSWHGHFTLARLYWEKGEVMKAAPEVGHTLKLKPDFAEAHVLAGNILLRLNQPQRAQIEYEEYLRLAPKGEYANEARELIDKLQKGARQPQP